LGLCHACPRRIGAVNKGIYIYIYFAKQNVMCSSISLYDSSQQQAVTKFIL
jgi:hypothetical protein